MNQVSRSRRKQQRLKAKEKKRRACRKCGKYMASCGKLGSLLTDPFWPRSDASQLQPCASRSQLPYLNSQMLEECVGQSAGTQDPSELPLRIVEVANAVTKCRVAPVRFGWVRVWGWNGSRGSYRFRQLLWGKGFSVSEHPQP